MVFGQSVLAACAANGPGRFELDRPSPRWDRRPERGAETSREANEGRLSGAYLALTRLDTDHRRGIILCVLRIIRDHNRLNGLRFCAIEFSVAGVIALGLAVLFAGHGAEWLAIIGLGIGLNCVPVVWLAVRSLRSGEPDIGLRAMLRPEVRAQAQREVPSMQRDTLILSGATLLPFATAIIVLLELRRSSSRG